MADNLLDGFIAQTVADAVVGAGASKPATLIKITYQGRDPANLAAGRRPVETPYKAQGLVPRTTYTAVAGTLVQQGDRIVLLLGATIAGGQVPKKNDKITIEGVTSRIESVDRDAASAAYVCLTRG